MLYRIKLGSITNAQRGRNILRNYGFKPSLTRLQNPSKEDGCGYVVKVKTDNIDKALSLLKQHGVNIIGVEEI